MLDEAEQRLRLAADAGDHGAEIALGNLLEEQGRLEEAEEWWRRAASTGSQEAAVMLGSRLEGLGRSEEARVWWERAAAAGSQEAAARLRLVSDEASKTEGIKKPSLREQVEWVSDSPASHDLLGRQPLARALATRLRRLQLEEPHTSFLIHVDGPWGAGKSTLLKFLRADLERDWLIVGFDAWRQSSIGPAWWALLAALRHDLARSLRLPARFWLRLAEAWIRVRRAGAPYLLALSLLLVAAAGVFLLLRPRQLDSKATTDLAKTVTAILSAVGTLWAGALVAGRFLLWDSARGARVFEQSNSNPMQEVADHFAWLLRHVKRPVVFLIDDLDRCAEGYVVELLDAVQTLLRDAPKRVLREDTRGFETYFVVAADGAWIRTSYEVAYQTFAASVGEPGRPLGHLFLDKLFQLTVPVPTISANAQHAYLQALLHTKSASAGPAAHVEAVAVRRSVEAATSEAEVVEALQQASPSARRLAAEDAVSRLSDPEVETATEHALQRFAPLIDPNPRSMKRFLNSYSMLRAVRTLEGNTVASEPLALWTILQTRWPSLADYLRRHPEAIEHAGDSQRANTVPEHLQPLLDLPEFQRLLTFGSVKLTAELVRACCGTLDS
jgi:tetratricopeptide (TPR) repeat protein